MAKERDETFKRIRGQVSKLDDKELFGILSGWYKSDFDASNEWRRRAREEFDFAALRHWREEDVLALEDASRPVILFDQVNTIINAISGIQLRGRPEIVYIPRGDKPGTVEPSEVLNAASRFMAEEADADDSEGEAFEDMLKCGLGWVELRMDYEEDPDGQYVEDRVDPLEMVWDHAAKKKNLSDARRVFRYRHIPLSEAYELAEELGERNISSMELDARGWAGEFMEQIRISPESRRGDLYDISPVEDNYVTIIHCQWIERQPMVRFAEPGTKKIVELSVTRMKEYEKV